ncbi:TadE/TadG family type IV pilus assembly protein [Gymnodinialimonas sp. 2305UL16-5]|uniref:TadE/TadG family type IV pilus assembly protein n=1 Tax=Gymnodinialimonas mytili TaxID=3126503 RepID=UPI00309CD35E
MPLTYAIRRFLRNESGTATLELVIVFPLLMIVFIAAFESAMILTRQIILERVLDLTVRELRLTRELTTDVAEFRQVLCAKSRFLPNCTELLEVDLQIIEPVAFDVPDNNQICANRGNDLIIRPDNEFETQSQNNQLLLVRTCLIVDPIIGFSAFGLNLARDESGGLHMIATSIFVNEPSERESGT